MKKRNPIVALCKQLNLPLFIVLDVGSAGENGIEFKNIFPVCQVHAVEPRSDSDGKLNTAGFAELISHNTALSDKPGPQILYITDIPEASSLLKPNPINIKRWRGDDSGFKVVEERTVQCETLETLSKRAGLPKCDFIKIDTQGTELNILLSGADLVSNTSIISMELEFVRLYQDQYLFDDIVRELSKLGFRFVNFTHGHSLRGNDWGNLPQKRIWCDALFLRDQPGQMECDEILKAAIILFELGYDEEAVWFMQDHAVDKDTIALIANLFKTLAVSSSGFVGREILIPIMVKMKKSHFPGRKQIAHILRRLPFTKVLIRNLPI